jgi:hypothetical protein
MILIRSGARVIWLQWSEEGGRNRVIFTHPAAEGRMPITDNRVAFLPFGQGLGG